MAKLETMSQDMIDRLIEIGRCYEMEINVQIIKLMVVSRRPSPVSIFDASKTNRICGVFQLPG